MVRGCLGCLIICLLTTQVGLAQDGAAARRTGTTSQPASTRSSLIFNEASPSDWLSTEGVSNSRRSVSTTSAGRTDLPISASMKFDDDERMERYQREYDGRRWSMARAQREREARQLRMETRKFYGISLSRPAGSPMMMGGTYAPNWIGGWNTAYGLPGQAPVQYLNYQMH